MRINHNLMAMNANRYLSSTGSKQSKSLEKISSGLRINSAADDAAGLAISEKMRSQISGLEQAENNAQDGISLIQTAEGALNETHSILQRMRALAVQSANDTNTENERAEMQKEVDELAKELTRISNNTEFNSQKLMNGGMTTDGIGQVKFHIGANASQDISLSIGAMDAKTLGVSRDIVATAAATLGVDASNAITGATFSGSDFGVGVVDGAVVTATYTAEVAADAGTASQVTGVGDFTSADLSGINADTSMTITVGATTYTVDNAALTAWDNNAGHNAIGDTKAFLEAASDGAGGTLADVATVSDDGTNIIITLNDNGDTDLTVNYVGTDAATVAGVFGMADGLTDTGNAVVAHESAKVTLTSDQGQSQVISVDAADTAISITSGNFKGLALAVAGGVNTIDTAVGDGEDNFTFATTSTVAAAATFTGGALVDEGVTGAGIDISTQSAASSAITSLDSAISTVSAERSKLGAYQNRLEHTINNLSTTAENLQASESRIRDVDVAKEMMNYTKLNILSQAAQSMLAQANQAPQGVLQLLR